MIEKFKSLVDGESELVDTIVAKAMKVKNKDTLRRFLVLVNSIIDYYLSRQSKRPDEKICFPIIYIPNAPPYTKKVFAEFLVLKLAIFYNINRFNQIKKQYSKFLNEDKEAVKYNKFVLSLKPLLSCSSIGEDNHKNLIFCGKEIYRRREDENRIMAHSYDIDDVLSDTSLTVCHNLSAKDITKILEEHKAKGGELNIDNVFVIYTNNDKCNSLSESRLEEWDCGIKNCFIFYFSDYPMRLRHTIRRKDNLRRTYLKPSKKSEKTYKDFITLTEEESLYLLNRETTDYNYRYYVEEKYIANIDKEIREHFKERGEPIKARIHFSLCLDEQRCEEYLSMLQQDESTNSMLEMFKECLHRHLAFAEQNILPKVKDFLEGVKQIAIILPFDALQEEKNMFKRLLPSYDINFYNLSDLKYKKAKSKNISRTKNNITETHIINFVYRPHYVDMLYPKYPNSFDSYPLDENQQILDIIDGFVFEDMYLWDKYRYEQYECNLMDSTYRKDNLDLLPAPQRPANYDDNIDEYREEVFDDERASTQYVSHTVLFSDGTKSIIPETENVIVATEKEKYITTMKELVEYQPTEFSLQKLWDIVLSLEEFMNKKIEEVDEERQKIRNYFYDRELIDKEEYESGVYIWKILLRHKVDELGTEKVYNDIIYGGKEKKDLTTLSFERWYDYKDDMILPRKKAHQLLLRKYLGLSKDYLKIMRCIKRKKTKDTKNYNSMEEHFLKEVLFQEISEETFDKFQNSEINEILGLENLEDLKAFEGLLEESVRPQRVKSIK